MRNFLICFSINDPNGSSGAPTDCPETGAEYLKWSRIIEAHMAVGGVRQARLRFDSWLVIGYLIDI
jgi:hypothetical protein